MASQEYIRPIEAAAILNVTRQAINNFLNDGILHRAGMFSVPLIRRVDVLKLKKERDKKATRANGRKAKG